MKQYLNSTESWHFTFHILVIKCVHGTVVCFIIRGKENSFGLNIFYSEEKDWARHTTRQCPLQRKYLQKNLITHTHTHTHTLPRTGCLIISNVTITRQYDSQVNITNYNLSLSSINLCTASKTFLLNSLPGSVDPYSNNSHEISVIVS